MKNFRKYFAILLIAFLMVYNTVLPTLIYAQEVTPTPTPDSSTTTIDNSATLGSGSNNSSNTGNNAINPTPTPTPDPSITPTDTPTPTPTVDPANPTLDTSTTATDSAQTNSGDASQSADTTITNNGDITNNSNSTGNSGENTATTDGSTTGGGHSTSSIGTGDATSVTNTDNSLNTVNINSNLIIQTVNIYLTQNSDINLADPITVAAQGIVNHPNDSTVNIAFTNINNWAYLTNDIFNSANTGGNSINSGGSAKIDTGNAFSLVSSINKVNFVEINSVVHLVTINIFGDLNGNIILPDVTSSTANCSTCGVSLNINNNATVNNNVNSTANSGGNTLNANGGSISTGDATSQVNILNLVNTNIISANDALLFINILGSWDGNFIGWGDFSPQSGGRIKSNFATSSSTNASGSANCGCVGDLSINNNATVTNNITSLANSGDNTINGGRGSIQTGNAFSLVSLFNLVNTNFINSFGFFGFINIFGHWKGNIGGQTEFTALNSNNNDNSNNSSDNSANNSASSDVMQQGGLLSTTNTNNVGQYVYPGDTVTFFVSAKNTGTGRVYGAKAYLYLIHNGQNVGGTSFELGDIDAGKGKKLTTGFVLSNKVLGGNYTARAEIIGNVGPNSSQVTSTADSVFNVFVNQAFASDGIRNKINPAVLGSNYTTAGVKNATPSRDIALYALLGTVLSYLILRGIRQRKTLSEIFTKNVSIKEKVFALRMFLL